MENFLASLIMKIYVFAQNIIFSGIEKNRLIK